MPLIMNFTHKTALMALAVLATATTSARVFADTYKLETVAYSQSESFAGGDDQGDYTINVSDRMLHQANYDCGGVVNASQCFETHYADGRSTALSATAPMLDGDLHTAGSDSCGASFGAGFSISGSLCNNGHLLAAGEYDSLGGGSLRGLWSGLDPKDFLGEGSIDGGFMSDNGNAFFIDGLHNTLDVALDLDNLNASPVPEPGSLLLVGTGALSALSALRRRRQMGAGSVSA